MCFLSCDGKRENLCRFLRTLEGLNFCFSISTRRTYYRGCTEIHSKNASIRQQYNFVGLFGFVFSKAIDLWTCSTSTFNLESAEQNADLFGEFELQTRPHISVCTITCSCCLHEWLCPDCWLLNVSFAWVSDENTLILEVSWFRHYFRDHVALLRYASVSMVHLNDFFICWWCDVVLPDEWISKRTWYDFSFLLA